MRRAASKHAGAMHMHPKMKMMSMRLLGCPSMLTEPRRAMMEQVPQRSERLYGGFLGQEQVRARRMPRQPRRSGKCFGDCLGRLVLRGLWSLLRQEDRLHGGCRGKGAPARAADRVTAPSVDSTPCGSSCGRWLQAQGHLASAGLHSIRWQCVHGIFHGSQLLARGHSCQPQPACCNPHHKKLYSGGCPGRASLASTIWTTARFLNQKRYYHLCLSQVCVALCK